MRCWAESFGPTSYHCALRPVCFVYGRLEHAVLRVHMHAGISAFGRGYVPGVMRAFPSKGMEMMAYNSLCEAFVPPGEQPTVAQSLAFGAVSAVLSQSLTMPLLSLRTKMMGQVRGAAGIPTGMP